MRGGPATAAAARSLAGVTPAKEALAACLPDCRPSPGQRQNKRSGGTDRPADADERGAYLSPAASRVHNREQKLTNKEEEKEGDRSTQQNSFSDFCIVA